MINVQVEDNNNAMAFIHTENQMHSIQSHSKMGTKVPLKKAIVHINETSEYE